MGHTKRIAPTLSTLSVLSALVLIITVAAASPAGAQVTGEIGIDQDRQAGTHRDSGKLLLFSPDPVQPGSSISHWDTSPEPDLLMEPSITPDLAFLDLDVTPGLMEDVGWPLVVDDGGGNPVQFNVFDLDPPGTGFTDPRPFGGAPGNPATTLGEARVNLFEAVLGAWGTALASDAPVDVLVTWQPLFCQAGAGAALAAAGPTFIVHDDSGLLPFQDTWYPVSLAESIVGGDISGPPSEGGGDIIVFINSQIDDECLGEGTGYYYGIDGSSPPNRLDLAPVVLHELGHGLGFTSLTDDETGQQIEGMPSVFDQFVLDEEAGKRWPEMTVPERRRSATNFRDLSWAGPEANAMAAPLLDFGVPTLRIFAPAEAAGNYEVGSAFFGAPIPEAGLSGEIACMIDAPDLPMEGAVRERTILDGCGAAENPGELAGKIALIDRGGCAFVDKARNAEAAGAIGAIIVNNAGETAIGLGGSADDVTIPVVGIGAGDGARIRQAACPSRTARLHDRFEVTVRWTRKRPGVPEETGNGQAVPITENTSWFYFERPNNPQLMVKIVNGCGLENPHWWVFSGGVTNQEVWITVVDTATGASKTYHNQAGTPFRTTLDTAAFDTCP